MPPIKPAIAPEHRNGDPSLAMAQADRQDRKNGSYLPDIHRMLPQEEDAEEALLSCVLLLPRQVLDLCRDEGITSDSFHIPAHRSIYETMLEMDEAKKAIDVQTLTVTLRNARLLDQVGGPAYVTEIFTKMPTVANTRSYVEILREKEMLRDIISVCTELAARAYDEQDNAAGLVEELEKVASRIAKNFAGNKTEITNMKTLVMESSDRAQERRDNKKDSGLPTGIIDVIHEERDFDAATGGLTGFTVIAGKTTEGKTAMGMTFAANIAIREKIPVGIISLEMSKGELTDRLIAMESPCNLFNYVNGRFSDADIPKISEAAKRIAEAPIYIDDEHGISIGKLAAKARAMRRKYKIEALFIDYFQLLSDDRKPTRHRDEDSITVMLTKASRILKQLNKELGIPVIVFAQVDPTTGRPKWCTAIEDDANNYYAIKHRGEESHIEILKQRSGPRDISVPFYFDRECVRFLPESMRPPPTAKPVKKKGAK